MSPRYLLDTNICIYIRRHRPAEVLSRFRRLKPGEAAISIITAGELLYGAEKSQHRTQALKQFEELASLIPVLALPREAATTYAAIRRHLEIRGETIGNNDLWIAAHAKAEGLILVTNNVREFKRVPALKVRNWVG